MKKIEDEAIELVYKTTNYDKFTSVENNRDVKESRFEKIKASFEEKEILNPIIVNELFEIIDGQGRFEVCKALGRPIKYIVALGSNIEDCRRMNHYNTPWSVEDFVESYANAGIESYVRLRRIHNTANVSYSVIQSIMPTKSLKSGLTSGNTELSAEQEQEVYKVINHTRELKNALMYTGRLQRTFYASVRILLGTDGYEPDRMIEKCKYFISSFAMVTKLEDLLKLWSKIYNYKTKVANKIYFEDYLRDKGGNVINYENLAQNLATGQRGRSVKTLL